MRIRIAPPRTQPFHHDCVAAALVIGRAADADVHVEDGSMSRRHARLYSTGGAWFVEDLGARNGTMVNGHRIATATQVRDGDVLRLGDTTVTIQDPAGAFESGTIFRPVSEIVSTVEAPPADDTPSLERYARRLRLLNGFQHALATPIALDALLDRLLERLFDALRPEDGVVLLKQRDGSLRRAATRRSAGSRDELVVSNRLIDEVVGKGTAALVLDAALDPRFNAAQSIVGTGIRSILAAPLTDAEGTLGMIALHSRAHVRQFAEEDLELLVSLASAAALRVRNVALAEEAAARRALERELAVAHDIQLGMLPRALPDCPGVDLGAEMHPARAVGGDLYDFFTVGGDLWFILGDVAGKGVGAALFMAVAKTLFRALVGPESNLADVMTRLNRELARDNDRQTFVTAFAGRVRAGPEPVLEFANAGHNLPLLLHAGGVRVLDDESGGPVLGILDGVPYTSARVPFGPGSGLVVYTDGVTEARSAAGAMYGDEALLRCAAACATAPAAEIVRAVVKDVAAFAAGAAQEDDITVLVLRAR